MKNFLKRFEDGDTEFFVMQSWISPIFEHDRKKEEYHIFFIKKNSNPEAYQQGYMNLKLRRMNRKEVAYFKENIQEYQVDLQNEDGTIYNYKDKPFDKSQCPKYKQFFLNLEASQSSHHDPQEQDVYDSSSEHSEYSDE